MLGDLAGYPWHVRRLPCEDIAVVTQEVDELTFLFGRKLGPDPNCLGWVGGVDSHRLGFLERTEGRRGGWFAAVWDCRGRRFPEPRKFRRVDDRSGELEVFVVAHEGVRERAAHSDDAVWSRHLQLELGVVGDRHKFSIAWPPQDGVVGP